MTNRPSQSYEEKKEAILKYQSHMTRISLTVTPDRKDRWQQAAEQAGMSLSAYIVETMERRMQEDFGKDS